MKKNYPLILIGFMAFLSCTIGHAQSRLEQSNHGSTVLNYLNDQKKNFNLSENDIADLYVNSEVFSKSSKTTNIYINQRYRGIKIFNAVSSVAVKNSKVMYYANNFYGALDLKVNSISPSINSRQAILNAVNHFNLSGLTNLNELSVDGQ
ncbi:peptidase, partial [Candidatus Bathyarchaeota archaeon]|nr:peptidase [Candidatus Bathyarchaeota archaeon]